MLGEEWWAPPAVITPEMLPLVALTQAEIDRIVETVPGGAENVQDIYPLAPLQEGILFHHLVETEGDPYLLLNLVSFERREQVDEYLGALRSVVERHDILRTAVLWEGLPEPVQVVWRQAELPVGEVDVDPAGGDAAEQLLRRFDPRRQRIDLRRPPLLRVFVARDEARDRWLMLLLFHHLAGDHTTLEVVQGEIQAILRGQAASLPAPLPFRNLVARARLGMSREEHEAFFTELLAGVDEPTAPFGLRELRGGAAPAEARLEVDAALAARVRGRARALGVSAASLFHVAFAQVLARASGRDDVVFGTVVFGRMQGGEGAGRVVGPFINTLPVRASMEHEGAEAGVRRMHALLARLMRHEHAPLALAQRCSGVRAPAPLFTSLLNYRHSAPRDAARRGAAGVEGLHSEERTNYPLAVSVDDRGEGFSLTAQAQGVEPARVCALVNAALAGLVAALEAAPETPLRALPVLPAAERRVVVEEWNATERPQPAVTSVAALFAAQAARTPGATAVVDGGRSLTYAELDARAGGLARALRARGVAAGDRVAVLVPRSLELVVAELAVLRAGAAYVPIDPETPAERMAFMVEDSGSRLVLARPGDVLPALAAERLDVDAVDASAGPLPDAPGGDAPAYVMYTSGSTGTPKGVVVPHRAIVRLVIDNGYAELGDRVAFAANPAFDATTMEVWGPLLNGGAAVVIPKDVFLDPHAFARALAEHDVGVLFLTTAVFNAYARAIPGALARLRCLLTGGEAADPASFARVLAEGGPVSLVHCYGPTEATTFAITHPVEHAGEGVLPLGRPIGNTRVYVLDARGEPAPVGAAGELYVGGAGVALGYLGRAALTAERFVPDPFSGVPGARLYRTGDVARWVPDGTVEFVGRADFQVKIRGFRIEPGEIEARLAEYPGVREAVVLAREDAPGEKRLVAYVAQLDELDVDALRAHLSAALPEYMVPAAYVRLDALPLTANGKVDRRALPAPEGEAFATREYEAPSGELEETLAGIWAEVLGVERIGRHDSFFALGGHSLLAVQLISRVRQALGAEVALGELFARPTLAEFAAGLATAGRSELPPIVAADANERTALSFAQQRLWFLEQLGAAGRAYHIPVGLRLRGALDAGALQRALDRIVQRHEALRTTFHTVDGEAVQRVEAASPFRLVREEIGLRSLRAVMAEEAEAPFSLEHGPLIRGRLVRVGEDDHVLLITMHHIVSDGWSMGVLVDELTALYSAFTRGEPNPLPPLPVQYADYAAWQRKWVDGEVLHAQAEYWKAALAGAPELLELPTDRPRPAVQSHAGAYAALELDEQLTAALKTLSARHGTTLYMTLLAGWAATLARLSRQDDVVVGTPTANRGRAEIEGLVGFFVNTLAVRVELADSPSVAELLGRVKARALDAQQHQELPFEQVVELLQPARSLAHTPLFQVMFAWQNAPRGTLELPGLTLSSAAPATSSTAQFDLSLDLHEAGDRIVGGLTYATALFDASTAQRYLGYLRRVLAAMAADDAQPVDRLPLLSADERRMVLEEWNQAEEYPADRCIHALFQAQAERTPAAIAVTHGGESLTYAELDARANRLARHLRARGVGPDARVAICVERSLEMVVAVLAVLKAGGAYVPLDPAYPEERLRYMLDDSAPVAVLAGPGLASSFAAFPVVDLAAGAAEWAGLSGAALEPLARPEHLAYVIYTSGSTGQPKGVMVEHRNVARLFSATDQWFGFGESDVWTLFHSFAFDFSVWEIWGALLYGGRLVVVPRDTARSPEEFYRLLCAEGVTVLNQTPSAFRQLVAAQEAVGGAHRLRTVVFGGEALEVAALKPWYDRAENAGTRLVNMYGITETTVHVTYRPLEAADVERRGASPIGVRIPDLRAYLLDAAGEPVPVGVAGELYVGGAGVARGYLNRPQLTAERFLDDPFNGGRMYRSGDLARWLPDGGMEYLGRNDQQVKIRGFRVELGEIEARLAEHAGVREAAVLARADAAGEKRLVAYYAAPEAVGADALRAHLAETLPEHMVPAAFVRLDTLPLTQNGKLDRRALPAPESAAFATRAYEAPVGDVEPVVAGIWAEVLGVERVGRRDHFFELGGHSLLAVQLISRVRGALGAEVALGELFARPVLAEFAAGLATAARAELPPIVPVDANERTALSFAQQRLWFLEQLGAAGRAYHIPAAVRLRGALDAEALQRALDRIVQRHEALRTTFHTADGGAVQRVEEAGRFHLVREELGGRALGAVMAEEAGAPFDLEHGPLIRGRLVKMAEDDHTFLVTMHHIVSDGWSMGVLTRELSTLYAAFARGEDDPLAPLPVQYADYAAWQRARVDGEVLREQAEYWESALAGAPELLELPTDRPRPAVQDHAGAVAGLELDEELTAALKALGARHGATLYMTLLAGWAATLARLADQDDVVIGTPTANRGRAEIEGLIGFFVNTLALRVDLSGEPTVAGLLERVKAGALEAQAHQDIPFEQVVERVRPTRSTAHTPLFQVMFAWQSTPAGTLELPGVEAGPAGPAPHATAKYDLSLSLRESGGRVAGGVEYATALFDEATVERFIGYLRRVLAAMAADERQRVHQLPLLSPDERRELVREWSPSQEGGALVHELFEEQARRVPDAVALVQGGRRLSYAELNARANRLAHHLRALGVGPDVRVAVCAERSPEMVVALLAILKAGGAYVPLDPAYPEDRLRHMLADSAPRAVLAQGPLAALFADAGVPVLDVERSEEWALRPETNPERGGLTPEHLVYIIYTSGSTGRPKGTEVPHRAIPGFFRGVDYARFDEHQVLLQHSSPSWDALTLELWPALLEGGTCVLFPGRTSEPAVLGEQVREHGVTTLWLTSAYFNAIVDASPEVLAGVRQVMIGGEAVSVPHVKRALEAHPGLRLVNGYGPSECTVFASCWPIPRGFDGAVVPIGQPIGDRRVYVLDRHLNPVPRGVPGELYVGGPAVARGYLNEPRLTAERFVPDPFGEAGGRLYRTGDRVCWRAGGVLEFLGRADFQVKVRGFRVEPGEIESVLAGHPQVREAVVTVQPGGAGDRRLVGYVCAGEATPGELRDWLRARLPEYMVPAAIVVLDAIPLTAHGKVDRRALPAPESGAFATREYEAPAGGVEETLAGIWAEVLGVERVGRRDDFFELGGHSLLAVQLASRVRQALGAEVALGELFARPTLAEFAAGLATAERAELPPIVPADANERAALSFAQQRLWFLEQLGAAGRAYHVPVGLRLRGSLDHDALERALDRIVGRHEALRTVFVQEDGGPVQRMGEETRFHLAHEDLTGREDELQPRWAAEAAAPFSLEHGPLVRGLLVRLGDDDHALLITMHHIVSDGWSMGVLTRELSALYAAFARGEPDPLSPLPVQYADYAAWQRKWVEGDVLAAQAEYWKAALAGAPELLELPTDRPRPAVRSQAGAMAAVELDEELTSALRELGRRHGATLHMTLLAAWAAVLGRLAGQDDVVIGTPTANRGRAEIEGLIGFFVNTLALRVDLSGEPTAAELLARVKARSLEAQARQDLPFEQVVELAQPARSTSHTPLFQVMFAWQSAPAGMLELPGLALEGIPTGRDTSAKFDLTLSLHESGGRIEGAVEYATALFDAATVERWLGYLRRVLEAMAAGDERPVSRVPLLSAAERRMVVEEWNAAEPYPADRCIHALFEAQAERTPAAIAVSYEGESLTYAELNARANRLAHHLRARGVGPDARVAICLERSPAMLVAVLAVLKAGGAYVPLDPAYPEDRLRYMLDDSAPVAVLTQPELAARFAGFPVVDLQGDGFPETNPDAGARPEHLAYIIYTSGSTGMPKGVMVEHRNVARLFSATEAWFGFGESDVWTLFHSFAFDFSVWEIWGALLYGGRLVVVPRDTARSPEEFYRLLCAEGVTVLNQTPSAFRQLVAAQEAVGGAHRLRVVVFGGEALEMAALRPWYERAENAGTRLVNMYGITETTVHVTYRPLEPADAARHGASPIGVRIPDLRTYILDAAGEPVPVGVTGELYVGGAGVARGYLNRPQLTAERFVADPFSDDPAARLYRSGDLARWRADGGMEYLGRNDQQVKIRGFRVELGEIETRLAEHADVREAAVLAREDGAGEKRLVAYYAAPEAIGADVLRAHLGETLPEHMIPAAFVRLDTLPLTQNGKLDRRAFPAPESAAFATREYEAPSGEVEETLAAIWAEVLGVERVGRRDHFFALGGHSLLAVQLISRVRRALGVEVALGDLFARPTLAEFAAGLATAGRSELPPIVPVDANERTALSFAQQRLWFLEQLGAAGRVYHIPVGLRLRGGVHREALGRALDRIVQRHEALRTTFHTVDGEPAQYVIPESGFPLLDHDLDGHTDAAAELERIAREEAAAPFHLERGPLIRGRFVRMGEDDHVLLITMHHIVSDGWSMGVLTRELSALYGAFMRGEPDPLAPLPVQYADYAAWQRKWVDGEVLREQADYWKTTLGGAPELLELPTDRPRPGVQDYTGAFAALELDEELTAALKTLSQKHGTTLYMTLLAAWAALLGRLSGQQDVVVGTPTANRGRAEIEGLIGFFVNTLAVRVELADSPSVAELLGRVKERALGAQQHQDIPFEQVVELLQPVRSMAHTPLFQALFAWQNAPTGSLELPGVALEAIAGSEQVTAKFDISLSLHQAGERISGGVEYATALFDEATIERYLGYFRGLLRAMAADDARPVDRIPLMGGAERARVLREWNATDAEFPREAVHTLFEAQCARTPGATAVVHGDRALTYEELNARANRLAHHLRARGVRAGERVAVLVPRSAELVVTELAALKAGAVYVPIDPTFPAERVARMVSRCGARFSLALAGDVIPAIPAERIDVDGDLVGSANNLGEAVDPEAPAYVMYTSGSTGTPKGVVVPHRAIVSLVSNNRYADFGPDDRVGFASNPAFDASTVEVWAPLLHGGRVVVIPQDVLLDPARLAAELVEKRVGVMWMTVGLFNRYVDVLAGVLPGMRMVMVGGDALDPRVIARVVERHKPRNLLNGYGPTETTTFALTHLITEVPEGARSIPLGRPIGNTRVYVLDAGGEPVPVGVAGELYIAGAGVALGYLGQPALTAERFVPDPFAGGRMYRTGDLARWLADGTIEFLGRNDFQVKVRGYRIELGEIEARLAEHPAVRQALVMAREDVPGDKRLVAYYVGMDKVDAEALRVHLLESLPEYMVPAAYVPLDAFPLTSTGKTDRRALPAPAGDVYATREYEAPAGEVEQVVAGIWSEVLRVERVGRRDHFFELGGHSLLAVQLTSRVRQALGVEVGLGELFTRPVLADFAAGLATAARASLPPIVPVDANERTPLSFAQQRLWFLEQMGAAGRAYHMPVALSLRGALDRDALVRALDRIVERHEALRTVFRLVDGEPAQMVAPAARFHLTEHDATDAERLVAEEAAAPFDLAAGPLIRGRLVRRADDEHVLAVTMHHIVSDGWSMGVLVKELSTLYGAFARGEADPLAPLPVQYADYAAWQRRWVDGEVLREQAEYWKTTLAGTPELLELPADRPRPAQQSHAGAYAPLVLDEELTERLRALSQRHGATLYMTVLAGWAATLGRLSGQDDVVIGSPTANRGRAEIEGLIGFFVNTLALRVDLSGAPTVGGLLERVKARALEAQAHQDIPFEQVVELVQPARSLAHTPLFQVMFAWMNAPMGTLELPGLTLGAAGTSPHVTAKFDLLLTLSESDGRIAGGVEYATALFDAATVERYLGYLRRVLEAMADGDEQPLDRLPLLPPAERRQVVHAFNDTAAPFPSDACIHELFEAQVERTPGAIAVAFEGTQVSYAELNGRANRLAHHLRALGVGPDARVAICLERSVEMVVGLLAILKAGGAYVPIDPAYPEDRLRYMLDDSAHAVLLTQSSLAPRFTGGAAPVVDLEADAWRWAGQAEANPERAGLTPGHLAYVIYTSGSTGMPKGVMLEHRGVVNRLAWMERTHRMQPGESLLQKTPFSFDVSVWEFFWPLMTGARLVMARPEGHRDPAYLVETIRRERITRIHFVPSMLQIFLEHPASAECAELPWVACSGEALSGALVRQFHERLPVAHLHNQYGPTESGEVTEWSSAPGDTGRVTIGRPIPNTRMYILGRGGEPVPVGVAGELFIGGVAVARGYLNRPRLTAERFVADPFSGGRMYRTGDLCRWLPDGTIEYLGRNDFQVKIRGFRVELGEIEARLAEHPRLRDATVLAREDEPGDRRLVAYYVGDEVPAEALQGFLSERLPEYMVPSAFVRLEVLPLTPNGKLDRGALPAPGGGSHATRGYQAPVGEVETAVAEIWAEVLRVERVGRHDHFFALGGHSLLAVRVVSRVRQALGVEAELGDLFVRPVLAEYARGLATAARSALPPIVPAEREGPLALSFAQQRLWFLEELGGAGRAYHIPASLRLQGPLDRDALRAALDRIVERHEALRTVFSEVDGRPVQLVMPREESGFPLAEHDLRGDPAAGDELRRLLAEESAAPFSLQRGPLVRGRLVRLGDEDHALLVTMHHIVADGWSMGVLTRELSALYGAFSRGEPDPLAPLPVQYADYAAWQRKWVDGEVLEAQADYWKTTLTGAPPLLELPSDRRRPAVQSHAGAFAALELDEELTADLKALSQRHGATLYMTLLAGWAATLGRLSGQDDVVVGSPTANRGRAEIEGLIGFFVNTLALRVDLSGEPSVAELLERVRTRALEAQAHQDIPFEQVVELVQPARSMAHAPLYQAAFAWQNTPERALELPGLTLGSAGAAAQTTSKLDITLALQETGGRIVGGVEYATALFDAPTVERWLGYLRRVLRAMAADDLQPVGALPLLAEEERRRVVEEWNDTDAEVAGDTFHGLFEAWARRTPHAVALVQDGETLTYAELDERAARLARHLRGRGVGPEARVAICVERSPEMVVALLAVLKAGGAFVPLDPAYPVERLRYMLRDSAPAALLVDRAGREAVGGSGVPMVEMDDQWPDAPERERVAVGPRSLAYIIYTSGSTGTPKGAMVEHGGVAALAAAQGRMLGVTPESRILQFASFSFDAAVYEVAMALCQGASLHLPPRRTVLAGDALAAMVAEHAITHATLPPAVLATLPDDETLSSVRVMVLAGDVLTGAVARRWSAGRRLLNAYGPTEATVWSTVQEVRADDAGEPAIGRPIPNTRVYLLDARGEPVPVGVAGELYIGGAGVARGYLNRPELTAERFVADPFGGGRMYRTGDLGRWLPNGTIDFLGRADFQVKVRGFRIEPGEIEARLASHPGVRDAVVTVRADASGGRRLVAYFAGDASVEVMRAHLADHLPEHMVPSAFVRLDALPITPNGKIDRRALPAPEAAAHEAREYEAPVGETEQALAEIWAEVLGVERVGRHDHFFELGGHSLLAAQAVSRARRVLGAELALADLFTHPTPAALARRLAGGSAEAEPDRAIPVRTGGAGNPLFVAHEGTGSVAYAQLLRAHLDDGFPVYALPDAPSAGERPRTIEGLAARLVRMIREVQPEGPYRLAGWSLGGLLAYEAATQLLAVDEAVELVAMMDTHLPAEMADEDGLHDYALLLRVLRMEEGLGEVAAPVLRELAAAASSMEPEALVAWCHAAGVLPAHVTAERVGGMLGRLRANRRALREYVPQPIPAPVHLFPAEEGPDPGEGWRALVPALRVTPVPGNHLSMMEAPGAAALGRGLSGALAGGSTAARAGRGYAPLVRLRSGSARQAPLFCVPGAGASVTSFSELATAVEGFGPVYGFQPRGLDGADIPHATVRAAAESYLSALEEVYPAGPVHLLGHSFGGWVAFEMAGKLRRAGRPVASLTLLDTRVPGDEAAEYGHTDAFLRLVELFEQAAERPLGIDAAALDALDEPARLRLLHGRLVGAGLLPARSDAGLLRGPFRGFASCLRAAYTPDSIDPTPLRLVVVDDPALDEAANRLRFQERVAGWRRWAPELVPIHGSGNHMSALKLPHVRALARML